MDHTDTADTREEPGTGGSGVVEETNAPNASNEWILPDLPDTKSASPSASTGLAPYDPQTRYLKKHTFHSVYTIDYVFKRIGGREKVLELLEVLAPADEDVRAVLDCYLALSEYARARKPRVFETICQRVGISPADLVGKMAKVAFQMSLDTSRLILATHLPDIMETSAEVAKLPEGVRDRRMAFDAAGVLPQKGPLVQVNQDNRSVNVGGAAPPGLPDFNQTRLLVEQAVADTVEGEVISSEEV